MRKKLFTFLLALATSVGMMWAQGPWTSGDCTVTLDGGVMTVSGNGAMADYHNTTPWDSYKSSITSIVIEDGVTHVGNETFCVCENLVSVTIGNDVETIGEYAFDDCYKFTTLTLGNSIQSIGECAFMWSKELTELNLPASLETIGDNAFLQCKKITTVTIPSKVTSIGESAFYNCIALTSIYTEATTPPTLGDGVFTNVPTSIPLYVPSGSVASYEAAAQWNAFNIQGSDPSDPGSGEEPEEEGDVIIIQTNTQQSSYMQSTVTITCDNKGDGDGFAIGGNTGYTATITNLGSSTISKIELVPGYYKSNHPYVRANGAEPTTSSSDLITFTDVNSNSVTLSMSTTNNFQIKEVRVTLVGGGSTDQDVADAVIALINAIPNPVEYNATCYDAIALARALYDNLTDAQKALVSNYSTLTDAEAAYAALAPQPVSGDVLPGAFTVDGDGKQINFSKANLQYAGSPATWKFAENQWSIIGTAQADDNRDLFGWGTGDAPNKVSMVLGDYAEYHEWGENMGEGWYTLSDDEWNYLFKTRANASTLCGPAVVNGVSGIIILPDDWTLPGGMSFNPSATNFGANAYADEAWETMENAGAVFLPVAGYRYNGNINWVGQSGYYWSSSVASAGASAWCYRLAKDDVGHDYYNLFYGMCVRLVKDASSTPTPSNACGDGLTWELNDGVLTISYDGVGTGEMTDFNYEYESTVNVAPWKENKSEITTVIVGDGVKSIGNYAFNDLYENFTAVTIANSVERIGVFAFTNSEEITEITLPSSLKTIDERGFANCGFTSITIPSGVTSIGYQAFSYCRALTSLTCEATTPPTLASGVFYKITSKTSDMSNIPLYVPSESVAAYEDAAQWNAFNVQAIPAPGFETVEIDFRTDPYTNTSGAATLVSGSFNDGQHGYANAVVSTALKAGNYKITVGNCKYGNGTGSVKNEDGSATLDLIDENGQTITSFTTPKNCYADDDKVTSVWFVANADQTIRIVCPQYTPYLKVEQVESVPEAVTVYTVTFANADDATGIVPAAQANLAPNTIITLPKNSSMYKPGATMTAWTDGSNYFAPNTSYTVTDNVTLTAVYSDNTVTLNDRTAEVTIKWLFSQSDGVPAILAQGSTTFVLAQAEVGGKTIDVQLPIDATVGKFANSENSWTQVNPGVVFSIPSAKDAVITYKQYDAGAVTTPEIKVTASETTYLLTAEGTSGQLYYEYIQVVLPKNTATAIDNASANANAAKRIENGMLLIEHNGKTYTVTGQQVK